MDTPDTIHSADARRTTRRGLLAALGLGGAATALISTAGAASAADSGPTDTMMVTAKPTASAGATPPKKLQKADRPLIAAAKVLELTAASLYAQAEGTTDKLGLDEAGVALVSALHAHHQAYAEALSGLYGPGSPADPSESAATLLGGAAFSSGNRSEFLAAAVALEDRAADTHLSLLGLLESTDAAALVASIQIAEARHSTALSQLAGSSYGSSAPAFETGESAVPASALTEGN